MSVLVEIFKPGEVSPLRLSSSTPDSSSLFSSDFDPLFEDSLDLNSEFIKNKATTFYAKVLDGNSDSEFSAGDVLVVDRSLPLQHKKMVVCYMDSRFTVRKICLKGSCLWLEALDNAFDPIRLNENNQHIVWGLVTYVVKRVW